MNCAECGSELADADELVFFNRSPNEVHLIVKPELRTLVEQKSMRHEQDGKDTRLTCLNSHRVGRILEYGPQNMPFAAFGYDKVVVMGVSPRKKLKWSTVQKEPPLNAIEKRSMENFFTSNEDKSQKSESVEDFQIKNALPQLRFPGSAIADYDWRPILREKNPRPYQITAFVQALKGNLIVALPTGAGKTLIASLLMYRMRELNPNHLTLMIVNRIPLVFQQCEAVRADTGLVCSALCSENRTKAAVEGLKTGAYDCLVATAGLVFDLLSQNELEISMFSCIVFDECHHAYGNSVYCQIMDLVKTLSKANRPRLLGLSASPFRAQNVTKATDLMQELRKRFEGAPIYRPPEVQGNRQKQEWILVADDPTFFGFSRRILAFLEDMLVRLSRVIGPDDDLLKRSVDHFTTFKFAPKIRGEINALRFNFIGNSEASKFVKRISALFECLWNAKNVDVSVAAKQLCLDLPDLTPSIKNFCENPQPSDRVQKLFCYIRQSAEHSKILVFVNTRSEARVVSQMLSKEFPQLNPLKLIGHGGFDGMDWEKGQEVVLNEFNSGSSNLIVCTSVLEEGLDVDSCNLVIRFSGVRTLIQSIQSSGRARKCGSRYVVLLSSDEQHMAEKIKAEEDTMETVLARDCHQGSKVPTSEVEKLIEQIQSSTGCDQNDVVDTELEDVKVAGMATVELFIDGILDGSILEAGKLEEILNDALRRHKILKPKRIVVEPRLPAVDTPFLSNAHTVAYVYLQKCFRKGLILNAYEDFCRIWDFKIADQFHVFSRILLQTPEKSANFNETLPKLKINRLKIGKFTEDRNFLDSAINFQDAHDELSDEFGGPEEDILDAFYGVKNEEFEISFEKLPSLQISYSGLYHYLFKPEVYGRFLIRSSQEASKQVQLFMFTSSVPIFFEPFFIVGEEMQIRRSASSRLLHLLSDLPVICMEFDSAAAQKIDSVLRNNGASSIPIFDASISIKVDRSIAEPLELAGKTKSYQMLWYFAVLSSARKHWLASSTILDLITLATSSNLGFEAKELVLRLICSQVLSSPTPVDILKEWESHCRLTEDAIKLYETKFAVAKNCTVLKRVCITPTRIIFLLPVMCANNRLLRLWSTEYPDVDLVTVVFADEQMQDLKDECTFGRVQTVVERGVDLIGRKYHYLCASASQFRTQRAYFVHPESAVERIRSYMVSNKDKLSVVKYSTRMGLFCSADKETRIISDDEFQIIPDQFARLSEQVVTDGAGIVSVALAEQLTFEFLELVEIPAAFQIRFAGMKGILVVDFNGEFQSYFGGGTKKILFRKSMHKFDTTDRMLRIVSYSKHSTFAINRELVTLLESLRSKYHSGLHLESFLVNIQEKCLEGLVERFRDKKKAAEALIPFLGKPTVGKVIGAGINILQDQFWVNLLRTSYKYNSLSLKTKTRITLEKAALLIGIPDPIGTLKDGEVYVNLSVDGVTEVVCGDILIFRNPSLHPGDVRKVKAVDRKELWRWMNVLIMPSDLATYSLSAQCSGGDLDGDKFAVIWEPYLVEVVKENYPALNYEQLQKDHSKSQQFADTLQPEIERKQMAEYFERVLSNDALGRVATMHLALCDKLPAGACDPLAIELSKSQSMAVDFPKTGILPEVPLKAKQAVTEYPDFMGKPVQESYASEKLLGKLYRRCSMVVYDHRGKHSVQKMKFPKMAEIDNDLLVPGYESYVGEAEAVYKMYKQMMGEVFTAYSLRSESELFLGRPVVWSESMNVDRDVSAQSLQSAKATLKQRFEDVFHRNMKKASRDDLQLKASAWYFVAYNDRKPNACLSFPWLTVESFLLQIKKTTLLEIKDEQIQNRSISYASSALESFNKCKDSFLDDRAEKLQVVDKISRCVNKNNEIFDVVAFGSVPLGIHSQESDVDICIIPKEAALQSVPKSFNLLTPKNQQDYWLSNLVSPRVDEVALDRQYVKNASVPVLKISVQNGDVATQVDITADVAGTRKTQYIQTLFDQQPEFFLSLWFLVKWARASEIIKGTQDSDPLIASAEFYLLCMNVCLNPLPKFDQTCEDFSMQKVAQSFESNDSGMLQRCHVHIETFYNVVSQMNEELELTWPISGNFSVTISEETVKIISGKALAAKHCLSVTKDVQVCLDLALNASDCTDASFTKKLPRSLAVKIADCLDFQAVFMSARSGANVSFIEDSKGIFIRALGSAKSIELLREEYLRLKKSQALLGFLAFKMSRYFIEGCVLILAQQAHSDTSRVTFKPSSGPYQQYHETHERSIPVLTTNRISLAAWKQEAIRVLGDHLKQQLKAFPYNNSDALKKLNLSVGFGCFYCVDASFVLPPTHQTLDLDEMKSVIERARRNRKRYERSEFQTNPNIKPNSSSSKEPKDKSKLEMIKLGATNAVLDRRSVSSSTRSEARKQEKRLRKKGLANSFGPGMLANNCSQAEALEKARHVYASTLQECGFTPVYPESADYLVKLTIIPSSSYIATMTLDDKLKVKYLEEKRLNWASITILHGHNEVPKPGQQLILNNDIRIRLQNSNLIKEGSDLYKFLFPTGKQISPVRVTRDNIESLKIEDHYKSESQDQKISHARVIKTEEHAIKNIESKLGVIKYIKGKISSGIEFSGIDLSMKRYFCDFDLSLDTESMAGLMSNQQRCLNEEEIKELSSLLIKESIDVSQKIKKIAEKISH